MNYRHSELSYWRCAACAPIRHILIALSGFVFGLIVGLLK